MPDNFNNFKCGQNVIIEPDVIIGDNVTIGHNVTLKNGTRILNDVILADYVKTTGPCIIGNHVNIRTGACISKMVIINDYAFIGPGVMTNHTKNVMWGRSLLEKQLLTVIGYGAIIGSASSLVAGVLIGDGVIIAAGSNIYKDIYEPGLYGGNPIRKIKDLEPQMLLKRPKGYIGYGPFISKGQ